MKVTGDAILLNPPIRLFPVLHTGSRFQHAVETVELFEHASNDVSSNNNYT